MSPKKIDAFTREYERRFRERTPPKTREQKDPHTRVTWREMFEWFQYMFGREVTLHERGILGSAVQVLRVRLQEEYPNERWELDILT